MKSIMENWKRFIKESSAETSLGQLSEKGKKQAEEAIKQLIALELGTEAAAAEADEAIAGEQGEMEEGRRASMNRQRKKERIQRTNH